MSGTFLRAEALEAEVERLRAVNALLLAACKQVVGWVEAIADIQAKFKGRSDNSTYTRASLQLLRQVIKEAEAGK